MLADEIKSTLSDLQLENSKPEIFKIDPAHVRRKFYDCAEAAGIARELAHRSQSGGRGRRVNAKQCAASGVQKIMAIPHPIGSILC